MEIKKTHIFMKYDPYTSIGAPKFKIREVHECRIPSSSLASSDTSLYFIKVGTTLELIDTKKFQELENETYESLKHLQ